jgi:hypothetical protein
MKHTFTFFAALLIATCVFAQSPSKLSYQAVIRNPGVGLIANQEVGIRISILQGTVDGTAVYTETQTPTSNGNGLVTFEIGTGVTSDDFSTIDWSDGPYFIKTETDPAGGTDYSITGTSEILSVPYALHAATAEAATSALTAATAGTISGTITESQVSDLQAYLTTENDPVFAAWDKSSDISITESQISDLQPYLTAENDPVFVAWDKSTDISITESQISDLQSYLTAETDPVFTASPAIGITATDISNLGNLSGVNSGDQDLSSYATRANVLELNNTTTFTPDADYEPATKRYVDDQISTATGGHYVGELFGGGVVFWVSADGTHGLVASLDDLAPAGAFWGAIATSVTAFSATDGAANTATMLASSPAPGTAAVLCDEYTGGGFSDWYLPSVRELRLLCSLDLLIDDMLDNDGDPNTNGFRQEFASPVAGVYWTSTAFSPDAAFVYRFLEGRLETNTKEVSRGVRAVRAF